MQQLKTLIHSGINISTATSLKEAHQWFENNTFDHVLLDFMLPDGSGLHLLDHLKIIGQSPKITLISGHPSVKGILADMCEPNIGHLLKPLPLYLRHFRPSA